MSFYNIQSFEYSNFDKNVILCNYVSLNKFEPKNNVEYKLLLNKDKKIESISSFYLSLEENFISSTTSRHPENALHISLSQGTYRIVLKNNGIYNKITDSFNDCINSSKGTVLLSDFSFINENKFDENQNIIYSNLKNKIINEFEFKMKKSGQFSIWIESSSIENLIGNIEFYIIKISNLKYEQNESLSYLFSKNSYNSLLVPVSIGFLYLFEIYELKNDDVIFLPKYKYPEGTYQITLNTLVSSFKDNSEVNLIKNNDLIKYDIIAGKIKSLNNIIIPNNINPINYYYMIGKIEFLLYFDFITDTYYFQQISFAECFMALYVPKSSCKIMEQNNNDTYKIFKITHYVLINKDFREESVIRNNIKSWLGVTDNDIYIDEYKLYYWIDLQNCDNILFYNITNKITDIDSYYLYVELNINGIIYDNVSLSISDSSLDYSISYANYLKLDEKIDQINFINWEQISEWNNYNNTENLLSSNIFGNGVIKITKQHFKNATGINIDNQLSGALTKEQLLKLNINEPELPAYNRFQYWLRTSKF